MAKTLEGSPILLFRGKMDTMADTDTGEISTLALSVESELLDLERPREIRLTHEQQLQLFPGDKGCIHVADIQDKIIEWEKK